MQTISSEGMMHGLLTASKRLNILSDVLLKAGCLVLYKTRPAIVDCLTEKIEIRFQSGQTKRVREKDLVPLHPGPVEDLSNLLQGDAPLEEIWELLSDDACSLMELADLIYGECTPASTWSAWQLLADGLYFEGTVEEIRARAATAVIAEKGLREEKKRSEEDWNAFLERAGAGKLIEQDLTRLSEVELLANGQSQKSKILTSLNVQQSPESAHAFLLKTGYWKPEHNPYPHRLGVTLGRLELQVPDLPAEQRLDLRDLDAYAIDDEDNQDPDDAISIDGDRIWVHVADVAALVSPDSELDLVARQRAANLYLPETTVTMLPERVTGLLGLGLHEESPALSIGFRFQDGEFADIDVKLTRISASRVSYQEADALLLKPEQGPLHQLLSVSQAYRARRIAKGAIELELPEVNVRIHGEDIQIRPLEKTISRKMVMDLMLMAGEAVAMFAQEKKISIPFVGQPEPESREMRETLAGHYAFRRFLRPSQATTVPGRHAGLGTDCYTRVTSPLRRYLDLITHQQLRAYLRSTELLATAEVASRIAETQQETASIRKAERLSNLHWKLLYLQQHPEWQGEAVVVELGRRKGTLLIPSLAMETKIRLPDQLVIDDLLLLRLREVDVMNQAAYFHLVS